MSSKWKLFFELFLKFIAAVILTLLVVLVVLKFTVFNKSRVITTLTNDNYYDNVYKTINENMENYIISSGFSDSILDNIFTKEDVKESVDNFVNNIYAGKKEETDLSNIREKINANIDKYISEQKIQILDQESVDSLVDELLNIYTNETELYGMINNFMGMYPKVEKVLNISLISLIIVFIVIALVLVIMKIKFKGIIVLASGLMLLYIRFIITNNIDYKNILLLTDNFSEVLVSLIGNVINLILLGGIILSIVGLIIIIINAIMKNKKEE